MLVTKTSCIFNFQFKSIIYFGINNSDLDPSIQIIVLQWCHQIDHTTNGHFIYLVKHLLSMKWNLMLRCSECYWKLLLSINYLMIYIFSSCINQTMIINDWLTIYSNIIDYQSLNKFITIVVVLHRKLKSTFCNIKRLKKVKI